jgi:hypothetical protein
MEANRDYLHAAAGIRQEGRDALNIRFHSSNIMGFGSSCCSTCPRSRFLDSFRLADRSPRSTTAMAMLVRRDKPA